MEASGRSGKWLTVALLGCAQFVMVLDTTVMNVSISAVVKDLGTTVSGVQLAITAYALVMAAFMLTGGRVGDIFGRRRVFAIGLLVYGLGSLTTSLAPNLGVLLVGWSLVEGLGATLVIPAIMALTAAAYSGRDRAVAYGILGGIAGAGAAAGPLIGGAVTTYLSWRYVFAAETVIVVLLLAVGLRKLPNPGSNGGSISPLEVLLTASGMGFVVLAVLKASQWGFLLPASPPQIGGHEITPLGLSPTPFMVGLGLAILTLYLKVATGREEAGRQPLFKPSMLGLPRLRAGLIVLLLVQLLLGGLFFVLPVFLQVTLGKDALQTGVQLVPLSAALIVASLAGPRLALKHSPKLVTRLGFAVLAAGLLILTGFVSEDFQSLGFSLGMAVAGAGLGLILSQVGNVIMSAVSEESTGEAGGLQGTAQNLGMSLGTALIGAVLLSGLTTGFQNRVTASATIPESVKQVVSTKTKDGVQVVSEADAVTAATEAGLPPEQVNAVADEYMAAQIDALRTSLAIVAIIALFSLYTTRRLPIETVEDSAGAVPSVAAA